MAHGFVYTISLSVSLVPCLKIGLGTLKLLPCTAVNIMAIGVQFKVEV